CGPCFRRRLHHWNEKGESAEVENALDCDGVVPWRPYHWGRSADFISLELAEHRHHVIWRVLHVDQHPIETSSTEHVGGDDAAEAVPDSHLRLLPADGVLEPI